VNLKWRKEKMKNKIIIVLGIITLLLLTGCTQQKEKCAKVISINGDSAEFHIFGRVYTYDNNTCCCNAYTCLCKDNLRNVILE
jgi:hypothetical protein